MVTPARILTVARDGRFTTFAPELLAFPDDRFILGNVLHSEIADLGSNERFLSLLASIRSGVEKCRRCDYFAVCGGGSPSNKYVEHRTFDAAETTYCRMNVQICADLMLEEAEARFPVALQPPRNPLEWLARIAPEEVITLSLPEPGLVAEGVSIVSGFISGRDRKEYPYSEEAIIPGDASVSVSDDDILPLFGEQDLYRSVRIVRMPRLASSLGTIGDASDVQRRLGERLLKCGRQVDTDFDDPLVQLALADLSELFEWGSPIFCHGYAIKPFGLPTVTMDFRVNRLIGLHIDDWDGARLSDRKEATVRICINTSREPRHFLYVPATVGGMVKLVSDLVDPRVFDGDATGLARFFARQFPNFPVMRVRVDPGFAYVAPTENMMHDASTVSMTSQSETITFRGHFRPRRPRLGEVSVLPTALPERG
jgi:radical SAM protein with 4Fe4S-binding SPASM domain